MHGMLQPMSSTITRVAWDGIQLFRCAAGTLAASSSRFATLAQPISSTQQPPHEYGPVVVAHVLDGLQHEGGIVKGHFDRCLPLGSYEAFLKKDSSLLGSTPDAIDPWDSSSNASKDFIAQLSGSPASAASNLKPTPGAAFTVDEDSGGVEIKWGADSSEPGMTLRGDPLEWFQHHTTKLSQDSRARTHAPLIEEQFLRQLTLEHMSRDAALIAYKELRKSAVKRGELGELQPVKQLLSSWMPELENAIKNEQMQFQRTSEKTPNGVATARELARAQYGPYLMGLSPTELSKLTIEAVLVTITMGEFKRRSKQVTRSGSATATAVVGAIGQRVQDTASFYAINAAIQQKQEAHLMKRKRELQALRGVAVSEPHDAVEAVAGGIGSVELTAGSTSAEDGQSNSAGARSAYTNKMSEAAERGRRIKSNYNMMRMRAVAMDVKKGLSGLRKSTIKHLDLADDVQNWDTAVRVRIGAALLSLLMDVAKVYNPATKAMEPAVTHKVEFSPLTRQTVGMVRLHERTIYELEDDDELRRGLTPKYMPMVVEPRPWTGLKTGGYLSLDEKVMKTRSSGSLWKSLRTADAKLELLNLFDALTVIGNVPWRINKGVHSVMRQLWDSTDGGELGIPSKSPQRPPVKVTSLCKAHPGLTPNLRLVRTTSKGNGQLLVSSGPLTSGELSRHNDKVKAIKGTNINASSLRNEFQTKMDVAERFVDEPCIYYPHQVDFSEFNSAEVYLPDWGRSAGPNRGRAYTLHPHLQHLGDDVCRGLLQFAEGKVLGQRGLYWLKVQVANLYANGKDKLSFDGRVKWVDEQLECVVDSATDPLGGKGWWKKGEKPWQLLATCNELYAAMSSDPDTFVSHISVHQDGSCNGLQHYAALGRDLEGGKSVNLVPSDQPQDVYKGVAEAVQTQVRLDADNGNKLAIKILATGDIGRGLVKQTVMTSVYGVTYVGARDQISGKLQERGFVQDEELKQLSGYLTPIVILKMGEVFSGARDIMKWLGDCARVVAHLNQPVQWKSPLGFPIEQHYRKDVTETVQTGLQSFTLATTENDHLHEVARRQQRTSFPPNYIHSLDSAHMMMTAMACREEDMSFAGVHDSYWTHACDVDRMNVLIREKFVELHSLPLMDYLISDIRTQLETALSKEVFDKVILPNPPELGDLNLEEVQQSIYFFS